MRDRPLLPTFVLLWSSGYVVGAVAIQVADPLPLLAARFVLASLVVVPLALRRDVDAGLAGVQWTCSDGHRRRWCRRRRFHRYRRRRLEAGDFARVLDWNIGIDRPPVLVHELASLGQRRCSGQRKGQGDEDKAHWELYGRNTVGRPVCRSLAVYDRCHG